MSRGAAQNTTAGPSGSGSDLRITGLRRKLAALADPELRGPAPAGRPCAPLGASSARLQFVKAIVLGPEDF
jgi:hypothetical protein